MNTDIRSIYITMLRKLFYFLAASAAVISSALIIVFPVWFFAVKYPSAYSAAIALFALISALYTVTVKLYRKDITFRYLFLIILKILYLLILVCGAGAVIVLYMNSLIFQGSVIMTVLFLVTGIIAWFNQKQEK